MNPIIGRGAGLLGALLLLVSVFVKLTDFGGSLWDQSEKVDILVLLMALAAGALIVLNLATRTPVLLPVAAGLGLVSLGIFLPFVIESGAAAIGAYVGTLGALVVVAGSLLAHLGPPLPEPAPKPVAEATPAPAAATPASSPSPEPAAAAVQQEQPAQAETLPPADWYPDPSGVARLRYWDGQNWTEQTAP